MRAALGHAVWLWFRQSCLAKTSRCPFQRPSAHPATSVGPESRCMCGATMAPRDTVMAPVGLAVNFSGAHSGASGRPSGSSWSSPWRYMSAHAPLLGGLSGHEWVAWVSASWTIWWRSGAAMGHSWGRLMRAVGLPWDTLGGDACSLDWSMTSQVREKASLDWSMTSQVRLSLHLTGH